MRTIEQIKFLEKMKETDKKVIVEGMNDKNALKKLGVNNLLDISGKATYSVIEKLMTDNTSEVIILTDFDREGVKKFKELAKLLNHNGIKTDDNMRKRFRQIFRIIKIEELNYFIKNQMPLGNFHVI
ncbi:MAG: toprim domain-containing protein [Candidatus Aenigmarchaeota archaeon]|nr:toprim domain-containing protein [Candidatus Aenigmarchaeota archaeon]